MHTLPSEGLPRRRRVLMISYAFPPSGGSGVQRAGKFAKHLPRFGWDPIVWCADRVPGLPIDESLFHDLPPELDRRVRSAVKPAQWVLALVARLRGESRSTRRSRIDVIECRINQFLQTASHWAMPDDAALWAIASLPGAYRLIRRHRIDAIWSTYSPASNHLLAWMLKHLTGLPWTADFRDLWTDNYDYDRNCLTRLRWHRWFEDRFLNDADSVVGVTPRQTGVLADRIRIGRDKCETIFNGVDLDDFAGLNHDDVRAEMRIPDSRFVAAYVGRLCRTAQPAAMISGIAGFLQSRPDAADRFELRIAGEIPGTVREIVASSGLRSTVTGYIPHRQAVREMVAADCLLLGNAIAGANHDSVIPGKLFEYLASGRPILHVGPQGGACDRVIAECQAGVTVPPDAAAVQHALNDLWIRRQTESPMNGCLPHRLAPYSRQAQAGKLARLLDDQLRAHSGFHAAPVSI